MKLTFTNTNSRLKEDHRALSFFEVQVLDFKSVIRLKQSEMDKTLKFIEKKIDERLALGNDDSFYVLDLDDVKMKHRKWIEKIPRVTPFYAVKCNDDERVLRTLVELGTGFDCASFKEIAQMLKFGVDPEKIIYANTVKQVSHLRFAAERDVRKVTFDCPAELSRIKELHPNAQVVLRIRFDSKASMICLGPKFGCDPTHEAPDLIKLCKSSGMNLIGISFHVGSRTHEFDIFERALETIAELFNVASEFGFKLTFVDIGGGFVGTDISLLDSYAKSINTGIDRNFKDESFTIISEPGRYFVESAFTLAVQITLKRVASDGHVSYYVNDGIFVSFLIKFIYEEHLEFEVIRKSNDGARGNQLSTLWGSSCNSKDKIFGDRLIPEMEIGDWLVFRNMGAYTTAVATAFNGFTIGDVLLTEE